MVLKGEKTILDTLEREDCKKIWKDYEPVEPMPTEPLNPGLSFENADGWFDGIQNSQGKSQYYLGIFTFDRQIVGDIQLSDINWRNRTAELGFGIAKKSNRKKGYATDAVRTLINFAFKQLDIYRVTARTAEYNDSSRKLLECLNFKLEGHERKTIFCNGNRYDKVIYGLLKDEWK